MMNYVANHHVSDRWLIDSGKQLDAPVGMAGFCLCLVHLSSDRNECWVTIRSNAQHTPPLSLWCSTVNNVDTAWRPGAAAAAAPYFQHEQGEGEWRWYLFQMNPGEAELEMWRGLLVMCCDVLCSLPGFTILCKKFAIKQLMSDTNTNNCWLQSQ